MDPKKLDEILKLNPNVDAAKLATGLEALRRLRETGLARPSGYTIEAPYSRPLRKASHSTPPERVLRKAR